jgi:hypothetical protein
MDVSLFGFTAMAWCTSPRRFFKASGAVITSLSKDTSLARNSIISFSTNI